jgi:hypothetical protein
VEEEADLAEEVAVDFLPVAAVRLGRLMLAMLEEPDRHLLIQCLQRPRHLLEDPRVCCSRSKTSYSSRSFGRSMLFSAVL